MASYERLDYGSPDGAQLGASSSAIGFYGGTPQARYAATVPQSTSRIGELRTFLVPASTLTFDATSATTEDTVSASSMAADSAIAISRSSTTPGIALVGARVSAANAFGVTYMNVSTAASIVPVSTQAYQVIEFKANGGFVTTAAWSPTAVAASTTAEQTVTVPGALPGMMVVVNKPTAQRQLGIANARVSAVSTVAVAFANNSSAAITPTAAETYTFALVGNTRAASAIVQYAIAATTLTAAVGISTTIEATTTLMNLSATDFAVGYSVPASQAGVFPVNGRVDVTSGVYGLSWANVSSGSLTPTSSHMLGISIYRPEARAALTVATTTFPGTSVPASTTIEYTSTVNGLVTSSAVFVNKQFHTPGIGIANARVGAANTITVALFNTMTTTVQVGAGSYMVGYTPRAPAFGIGGSVPAGMAGLNSTCCYMTYAVDPGATDVAAQLRTAFSANGFLPG